MYVRGGDKKRKAEYEILCKIKKVLIEESRMIRSELYFVFFINSHPTCFLDMETGTRQILRS